VSDATPVTSTPTGGRMTRWGRALRTLARRARDVWPLTWLGLVVACTATWALITLGIRRVDLLLLVIGGVGCVLTLLSLLVTAVTGAALYWSLRRRPLADGEALRLECGHGTRTGFSLPSLWWVPFVHLSWTWRMPDVEVGIRKLKGRVYEEITPSRRGLREEIVRRIEVRDVFGLAKVAFQLREKRDVRFIPSMGALKSMHVVRSMSGGSDITHPEGPQDGERMDMRSYNPGDPIRFILWKVFARSRQLMIRTPERAISPVRQTVAYLVSGPGDEPAAGAARVAVDTGALGNDWVLGTDGAPENARSKAAAIDLLARSAEATEDDGGEGLARFLRTAVPGSNGRAVVFVPGRPGPWLPKVVAAARARATQGRGSPVEFVVCTDGVQAEPKKRRFARFFEQSARASVPGGGVPRSDELAQVVDALAGARARVLIVDRRAGRCFDGAYRQAVTNAVATASLARSAGGTR
jgi:hypothetical protein